MDCRETQALLTAFHDGELPDPDRARVEGHLRGCPTCRARLDDLERIDAAASVPDPGPGYWDRFNARVMDRVERETEGRKAAVLRPEHGWVRQQLRYLVPAVAAAAMVVVIVRLGGMHTGVPAPTGPPEVRKPAGSEPAGERAAKAVRESPATKTREPAPVGRRAPEEARRVAEAPAAPPPVVAEERLVTAPSAERDRMPDRPPPEANDGISRDRAAAVSPPATSAAGMDSRVQGEQKRMAEEQAAASLGKTRSKVGASPLASASPRAASPCEQARTLAARGRWKEAEAAQRECLAQDRSAPSQEKGLVFLAELLDRQERFAEADAVITEVDRQFPQSRPLDLYRQQRPMVQKQPTAVPVTR